VLLGAGFDCRASRLAALAETPVFEVNRAALLADKQRRLQNAVSHPDVVAVPVALSCLDVARGSRAIFRFCKGRGCGHVFGLT
jgi:O-methyltransferase involved in polyketide biosynthesis